MFEFSFPVANEMSARAHVDRIDGVILNFLNVARGTESVTARGSRVVVAADTVDRLNQLITDLIEEGIVE